MNDVRVSNWSELMQALYDIPKNALQRYRSDLVYRGLADASRGLENSLMRLGGDYANIEKPMLRGFRGFRKYAEPGSIPAETLWVQLAVAQHYGLPTRLLDWTNSAKVTLHFAAEEEYYDRDAAIWCINVVEARSLLPQTLRLVLKRESAFLFSVEMLEFIRSLDDFDRLGENGTLVLFLEPPSLDARIVNQGAVLSAMPGVSLVLSEFLLNHPALYYQIIIPKEIKWEVRDKLDQDNVTERMLFPGLDGLSRWLKRYYGPGPCRRSRQ